MEFTHLLVVVSACVVIFGASRYIIDTIKGETQPNRITWLMWSIAPLIGSAAAIASGAGLWATARVFLSGFFPLLVLIASFVNKKSYWKLTLFDSFCGICSLLALIFWLGVHSPQIAVLLAAIGDGFALLPTLLKAWKFPQTETGITYIASLVATILVLPSIPVWNIVNSAFQIYLLIANSVLIIAIYRSNVSLKTLIF